MLKFFVNRPVTTIMFVLFWVALGITSLPKMNIEEAPPIDFPMVSTTFIYPGATSLDIESLIVSRAEDAISEIAGLKKTTSKIFENGAFVMAEFNIGVNVNDKAAEVKAKLDKLIGEFPADMESPLVEKLNILQIPIMDIMITGADAREIDLFIKDVLGRQITALPGIASISVSGGQERAVRIQIIPELMASHGATIMDIVGSLSLSNLNIPGGKIELGTNSNIVRFTGEFSSINDISNLELTTVEGSRFKLSEIAKVSDEIRDIETGARYNGEDVVLLSIQKASDGNAIKISNSIRRNFNRFEKLLKDHFKNSDVSMKIISDSSITVFNETKGTFYSIIIGIFLTALTLLIFTKNWRTTIISAVVIPATLLGGFFFMNMSGFSINILTLLAMATALGSLISSAIILIESALGKLDEGATPEIAAIEGTKKVVVPVLAATGTNLVVFLPLAFMGGIAGIFMKNFGISVVYLTLLSLMFSFTLTPMMIAKILRKKNNSNQKERNNLSWFKNFFYFQMQHPWITILASFILLISSTFLMKWVGNEFQPRSDMNTIAITARTPVGTTYKQSLATASIIEKRLTGIPEIDFISTKIGARGTQNISIKVGLIPAEDRNKSDRELVQYILPKLADIPGVEIQAMAGSEMSDMISSDMVLNITGLDDDKRNFYAKEVVSKLNKISEIQSVTLIAQSPGSELKFIPDNDKMHYYGVSNQAVAMSLRTALFGNDSLKYKENGKEYPIIIELDKDYKTYSMFESIFVASPKGLIPLSKLGTIETSTSTPDINRLNKARITEIGINIGKSTIGAIQSKINDQLKTVEFEEGYNAVFSGMTELQDESTAEMISTFLLATILTYMLLAALMNSFIHPLTVSLSIVYSFSGVFLMLFLTGSTMNIAAMLSIIMLVGLAVNNNILILEPAIARIANGESVPEALWFEFKDKTRMLFMTTIAVAAGMVPQLWSADGMKSSMGSVIIGGMLLSLFWTFAVTPAQFLLMEKFRLLFSTRRQVTLLNPKKASGQNTDLFQI